MTVTDTSSLCYWRNLQSSLSGSETRLVSSLEFQWLYYSRGGVVVMPLSHDSSCFWTMPS
jgi:hypothetical protein